MSRQFEFEPVEGWEQLPEGFTHRDAVGVAIDGNDRVYVITRMDARVIVYERDGTFVTSWGEGIFTPRTHCIKFGPDGAIYTVDDGDHTVRKFTPEGQLLMTLGTPGVPSDTGVDPSIPDLYDRLASIKRSGPPFNKPTGVALAQNGEIYVCDGYGNARVHRFTANGELIQSWGEPGIEPGQFNLPHDIWVTPDCRVLVADRENDRVQLFSLSGEFLDQWTHLQRPIGLGMDKDGFIYVAEHMWFEGNRSFLNGRRETTMPARISVLDPNGSVLARWGGPDIFAPGNFVAPHGLAVDSHGDVYVAEVAHSWLRQLPLGVLDGHTLQKFRRR